MNISKNCNPNIKILRTFSMNRYIYQQKSVRKFIVWNFEVFKFSTDMDDCHRCYPIIAVIAPSILSVR